jgi:phosphatidylglycerol lysyltransferase
VDNCVRPSARELVMQHGWNATAYQILNPGIDHWFSQQYEAVAGYTRRSQFLLAAGAPICSLDVLPQVVREFEEFAASLNCKVCYVCAAERLRTILETSPEHSTIAIGAEPVWDPHHWPAIVEQRRSLRAQLHRAKNKGVVIGFADARECRNNPDLHETLREWVESRCLPPLHFLTEPETLQGESDGRRVLIATRDNRAVAFLVASPVVARNGYLIEQIARSPRAPNGTSELLIDTAMRFFIKEGCTYATLGLVALSNKAPHAPNPPWLSALMWLARSYANRFYNFQGLERFRAKMSPDGWEAIYAISNERQFSPFALYAVGSAFAGISPWRALAIAVFHALRTEWRSLRRAWLT